MVAALHAALTRGARASRPRRCTRTTTATASPCRRGPPAASELERLAAAVRDHEGTTVELIVPGCLNGFTEEEIDFLDHDVAAGGPAGQLERARRLGHEPRRRLEPAGRGDGGGRSAGPPWSP